MDKLSDLCLMRLNLSFSTYSYKQTTKTVWFGCFFFNQKLAVYKTDDREKPREKNRSSHLIT